MTLRAVLVLSLGTLALAQDSQQVFDSYTAIAPGPEGGWSMYPIQGHVIAFPVDSIINSVGSDGRAVYALAKGENGITKFDLVTGNRAVLLGTGSFPPLRAFAVSQKQDFAFVVATSNSSFTECGVYSVSQPDGRIHTILKQHSCPWYWPAPSISRDGKRVLLRAGRQIELINLTDDSKKMIGSYDNASWAPDGESIAAFGGGRLVLLDPISFKQKKSLGKAWAEAPTWSPDSKYLLIAWPSCGPYFFSLSYVDIATGKRTEVKSAHCLIQTQAHLVLNGDVYRKALEANPGDDRDKAKKVIGR